MHVLTKSKLIGLVIGALLPAAASAHVFGQPYTLPVPFSMYAYGAMAALLLSFIVVGLFAAAPALGRVAAVRAVSIESADAAPRRMTVGSACSVFLLVLCIVSGLIGTQNAFANFNMTFFWIGFVLGLPYAVALLGDFYAPVNPWKTLASWLESASGMAFSGRLRYPAWLGYTPALLLYMSFIWLELFGQLGPRGLSVALLGYTLINLIGAYVFGRDLWFRQGEFFGVLLHLIGKISPWSRPAGAGQAPSTDQGRRWRLPFSALADEPASHLTLVLFILFMLSSTAFDGLHSTLPWVNVFWKSIYPDIAPWFTPAPGQQYLLSTQLYYLWQWGSLLLSPLIYLLFFAGFMWAVKVFSRSRLSTRELVLRFAMSLLPIAFVYHVTHYYTLLLSQGGQLFKLVSDPFGYGWNLFGTAKLMIQPMMLDVELIWHTQVALILLGHIVGVYLAHVEALRSFSTPRRAALSQLPMLALMMVFTNFGLWILSMPLAGGN